MTDERGRPGTGGAGQLVRGRGLRHDRAGPVGLVYPDSTAVAAIGLIIELLPVPLGVSIAAIAVYSLGLSVLVPVVFGAVGHGSAAAAVGPLQPEPRA